MGPLGYGFGYGLGYPYMGFGGGLAGGYMKKEIGMGGFGGFGGKGMMFDDPRLDELYAKKMSAYGPNYYSR